MKPVANLTGHELDYWVLRAQGKEARIGEYGAEYLEPTVRTHVGLGRWNRKYPSSQWADGGGLIEDHIARLEDFGEYWEAECLGHIGLGPTALIAAARAYVKAKMGDIVV